MNKPLKIILLVLAALVLLVVGYLAYVLIDYHRLGWTGRCFSPPRPAGNITCCPITSASAPMSRITASLWTAERSPGPGPRSA